MSDRPETATQGSWPPMGMRTPNVSLLLEDAGQSPERGTGLWTTLSLHPRQS